MTIDWWTLGFQAVNVLVLVWLLQHFFWRPVAAMIEQRRAGIAASLRDAKAELDKADAAASGIAATRAGFAGEHDAILAAANTAAAAAAKVTLEAAAREAAAHTEAARAAMRAEHDADEAAWGERASALAVQIAGRLAARLQGPAVSSAFLDWLVSSVHAMPESARQAAVAEAGGFEAVSAEELAPAEQAHTKGVLAEAFGAEPQLRFRTDPGLIAGIELHGPHLALANSWRADLGQITKQIRHAPGR